MPWRDLGELLTGGFGAGDAYHQHAGQLASGENALAQARLRRDELLARERLGPALAELGLPGALDPVMRAGFGNFPQVVSGLGGMQEMAFRDRAGDPNVPFEEGQRALMGVASGPVVPIRHAGGEYVDIFDPGAGVRQTPLGDALVEQRQASAEASLASGRASDALANLRTGQLEAPERFRASGAEPLELEDRVRQQYALEYARRIAEMMAMQGIRPDLFSEPLEVPGFFGDTLGDMLGAGPPGMDLETAPEDFGMGAPEARDPWWQRIFGARSAPAPQAMGGLSVGTIEYDDDGNAWEYVGGDPGRAESWREVAR